MDNALQKCNIAVGLNTVLHGTCVHYTVYDVLLTYSVHVCMYMYIAAEPTCTYCNYTIIRKYVRDHVTKIVNWIILN